MVPLNQLPESGGPEIEPEFESFGLPRGLVPVMTAVGSGWGAVTYLFFMLKFFGF
jgi:hypothetical protein